MSKAVDAQKYTNTVGYYNANSWPVQLVISELNVQLTIQPKHYVLDAQGRKINDSFFDRYTRPLQLSKEITATPVPLVQVPRITQAPPPSSAHSVHSVTEFETDRHGVRRPVLTAQRQPVQPPANQNSIKAMSMEDARNLGFVGKVREVPEDFGAKETGSGAPVSEAPSIRYAIESTPRVRTQGELPKELTTPEYADENGEIQKLDPRQAAVAQQLQQGLAKAAKSNAHENPTGFLNESTVNTLPQPTIIAPNGQPASALPTPNIPGAASGFAQNQIVDAPTNAPTKGRPAPAKTKAAKKATPPTPPAKPVEEEKPFVCSLDNKRFKYRSQLKTHARRKYPEQEAEILAPYPEQPARGQAEEAEQPQAAQ